MIRKKILLISHNALSSRLNNGKTLAAIFSAWKDQEFAQLYFQDEIPESVQFSNFFRLRDIDIIRSIFSIRASQTTGCVIEPKKKIDNHFDHWSPFKRVVVGLLRTLDEFKVLMRDFIFSRDRWLSDGLLRWVGMFKPESVFLVGGNYSFSFCISRRLSFIFDVPLDIFITDDYVINHKPFGFLQRLLHKRLLSTYVSAFSAARNVFVIGSDMAEVFSRNFSREFIPVMNAVDMSSSVPPKLNDRNIERDIKIVYAGGLHLGRDLALSRFGSIVKRLQSRLDIPVNFYVYSSQPPSKKISRMFDRYNIKYSGYLTSGQLKDCLSSATFVLHVESFDDRNISKTKLSVSTKIPEYLISGACLVAYGPSEVASIRLISNHSLGVAITEHDDDSLAVDRLTNLFLSSDMRYEIACKGYKYALENFSQEVIGKKMDFHLNFYGDEA